MFYIIENMFQLPFYSTFSISLLPCLQISENKDNQRVCVQYYQVIDLNTRSPTVSNKQLRNVRLFWVRKQKKSKVSCSNMISSADWQKFENIRHLACGPLLKKVRTSRIVLFCVAFDKVRCDFTSSAQPRLPKLQNQPAAHEWSPVENSWDF